MSTNNTIASLLAEGLMTLGWVDDADELLADIIDGNGVDAARSKVADIKAACVFIAEHGDEDDAIAFGNLLDDLDDTLAEVLEDVE